MLTRSQIEARIPHAGSMCLLDRVARWDETQIVCHATAPTAGHPFAAAHGVPVVASVEYAAQAAALHGALLDDSREPHGGMLATLSEVELTVGCLDQSSSALTVEARLIVRGVSGCTYSFTVQDARGCRARGRLLVTFANVR
jgi:predicted hotdog family 3-hydroxylacyl-ACP dehydratase